MPPPAAPEDGAPSTELSARASAGTTSELGDSTELVTMRHLLSMQSGIPDYAEDDFDVDNGSAEDLFVRLGREKVALLIPLAPRMTVGPLSNQRAAPRPINRSGVIPHARQISLSAYSSANSAGWVYCVWWIAS